MPGPPPEMQRHIRPKGETVALCGYDPGPRPPAPDPSVPGRREQRMTDCADCWEVMRSLRPFRGIIAAAPVGWVR